jgi:hypothetical protein
MADDNECAGCGMPVDGEITTALGQQWHADCFCCQFCNKGFPDGSFVVHEGMPFHDECHDEKFADRCSRCGKVLKGTFVQACGGLFHDECFVCTQCGKSLDKGFVAGDGKPFCGGACKKKAQAPPVQQAAKYEKQAEVDGAVQAALAASATAKVAAAEEAVNPRAAVRAELFGGRKQLAHEFSRELARRPDVTDLDSEGEEELKSSIQAELAGRQMDIGDRQRLDAAATASQAPDSGAHARFDKAEMLAARREAQAKAGGASGAAETLFSRMESRTLSGEGEAQLSAEVGGLALDEDTEWFYLGADGERQAPPPAARLALPYSLASHPHAPSCAPCLAAQGPRSTEQLLQMYRANSIDDECAVWSQALGEWQRIRQVPSLVRQLSSE